MNNLIAVITKNPLVNSLVKTKIGDSLTISIFEDIRQAIKYIYNFYPTLIVVELNDDNKNIFYFLKNIKEDSFFSQTSILAILPDDLIIPTWEDIPIDDYIRYSDLENDLSMRVNLCLSRSSKIVEINPLTKLPGNTTIIRQLQQRIEKKELFAVAYADLDYFKPFNDRYGFSRGDEVIKMLGRLIYNIVKDNQRSGSFVGHIGGDDFIYIMNIDLIEKTTETIIYHYDRIILSFYDYEDRIKGYIESIDREGNKRTFPIMCLSIGITHNKYKTFVHYGEITQILADLKNYAKTKKGSFFIVDRRV
ncbi:MAG: diguanylate cyclase [Thermodesulfovibrionales bacterium]|nr:diguanylate cyclase [Thermodesulfovibrionales bacterium]